MIEETTTETIDEAEEFSELSMTWDEKKPKHMPGLSEADRDWTEEDLIYEIEEFLDKTK